MFAALRALLVAGLSLVMALAVSSTAFGVVRDGGCSGRLPVQPMLSPALRPCPPTAQVPVSKVPVSKDPVTRPPVRVVRPPAVIPPAPGADHPVSIMPIPVPRQTLAPVVPVVPLPEPRATILPLPAAR